MQGVRLLRRPSVVPLLLITWWITMAPKRLSDDTPCPKRTCRKRCTSAAGLVNHWAMKHLQTENMTLGEALVAFDGDSWTVSADLQAGDSTSWWTDPNIDTPNATSLGRKSVVESAMECIDEMKFRYYSTDANVARAKVMTLRAWEHGSMGA